MSFSFLGGLAGLLPGYLQGQRMAVNDNWNDLMKYNQAQAGQLQNAFTEATWQPRLDTAYAQGMVAQADMWPHLYNALNAYLQEPYQALNSYLMSYNAPPLAQQTMWNWLMAGQNARRAQQQLGGTPATQG